MHNFHHTIMNIYVLDDDNKITMITHLESAGTGSPLDGLPKHPIFFTKVSRSKLNHDFFNFFISNC